MVVDHFEDNVCESTFEVMKAVLMGCIIVNKNCKLFLYTLIIIVSTNIHFK